MLAVVINVLLPTFRISRRCALTRLYTVDLDNPVYSQVCCIVRVAGFINCSKSTVKPPLATADLVMGVC